MRCDADVAQELIDPVDRMVPNAPDHLGEVGLQVDPVELGRFDQTVNGSGALATGIGAGEQPVLSLMASGHHQEGASSRCFALHLPTDSLGLGLRENRGFMRPAARPVSA